MRGVIPKIWALTGSLNSCFYSGTMFHWHSSSSQRYWMRFQVKSWWMTWLWLVLSLWLFHMWNCWPHVWPHITVVSCFTPPIYVSPLYFLPSSAPSLLFCVSCCCWQNLIGSSQYPWQQSVICGVFSLSSSVYLNMKVVWLVVRWSLVVTNHLVW